MKRVTILALMLLMCATACAEMTRSIEGDGRVVEAREFFVTETMTQYTITVDCGERTFVRVILPERMAAAGDIVRFAGTLVSGGDPNDIVCRMTELTVLQPYKQP